MIRLVLMAGVVIATARATGVMGGATVPPWRAAIAWVLVAVVIASLMFANGRPRLALGLEPGAARVRLRPWRLDARLGAIGGISALVAVVPSGSLTWLPFVAAAVAAVFDSLPIAVAAGIAPLAAVLYASWQLHDSAALLLVNLIGFAAVMAWVRVRVARREARELADAREQVIVRERARSEAAERQRVLAAQLHDVLAHTLSGLIVSLQTTSLQARQEDSSKELQERLSAATALAKDGLVGARQAVESLRADIASYPERMRTETPLRSERLADDALAAWWRETTETVRATAGLAITTDGDPDAVPHAWVPLARSVLREAVTNSMRHAAGQPVIVTFRPEGIRVLSRGDVSAFEPSTHSGGGFGLDGLRERVEAAGGLFTAEAQRDGWLVALEWPTEAASEQRPAPNATRPFEERSPGSSRRAPRGLVS